MNNKNLVYKVPSWHKSGWKKNGLPDDATLEKWRKETEECDLHNKAVMTILEERKRQAAELIEEVFGKNSNPHRYILKQEVKRPVGYDFRFVLDYVENEKKRIEREEREKKQTQEKNDLTQEAIIWLTERGKKLGEDFTLEDAIQVADDLAFDEVVKKEIEWAKSEDTKNRFQFDGDDYCENCSGWDGQSNRCECGNRRVSWVTGYGHSFKAPFVYAEAH